jgi:hypothetical protein
VTFDDKILFCTCIDACSYGTVQYVVTHVPMFHDRFLALLRMEEERKATKAHYWEVEAEEEEEDEEGHDEMTGKLAGRDMLVQVPHGMA